MSKEDNKEFIEQQKKGFQRYIYWNEYKTKEQTEDANANAFKYINLDLQGRMQGAATAANAACQNG